MMDEKFSQAFPPIDSATPNLPPDYLTETPASPLIASHGLPLLLQAGYKPIFAFDIENMNGANKLGMEYGDKLLALIVHKLSSVLPEAYYLVRTGGDEFVVITQSNNHVHDVHQIVQSALQDLYPS